MKYKLKNSKWDLNKIDIATMVPTTNQQMEYLFFEISKDININFINHKKIFRRIELSIHYEDRRKYVKDKYFLQEKVNQYSSILKKSKYILIFDDIFHQGFTLSRIIELLQKYSFDRFYLATVARTTPKSFKKTLSFP